MSRLFNAVTTNLLTVATDVAALKFDNPDTSYSIHFRHRMRAIASGLGGVHMVSKYDGTGFLHRLLPVGGIAYHSYFLVQNSGSSGREITSTKFPIRPGIVYTYGASCDTGTSTQKVYTDGYYDGSITFSGGIFNTTAQWKIGYGNAAGSSAAYNGEIQDVCIWTAVLTDAEFRALAEGIDPRQIRPANIAAYWPMNNMQGGSSLLAERDLSTNLNPMTVTGVVGEGELLPPSRRPQIWMPGAWDGGSPWPMNSTVIVAPPVNTVAPVASGTPEVGQTLSCTSGTWSPPGDSYTYQWQYNDGTWHDIAGATSATWVVTVAGAVDVTDNIKCVVTATNGGGSASADSNTLGPVTDIVFTGHASSASMG